MSPTPATISTLVDIALPQGLAVDGVGNLYILDIYGGLWRLDAASQQLAKIGTIPLGTSTDNVGIRFDPTDASLWAIYNDVPGSAGKAILYQIT